MALSQSLSEALRNLSNLDLSVSTHDDVEPLFDKIGQMVLLEIPIAVNTIIARTRCELAFDNIYYEKDISFIADPARVRAARANIENMPTFYGAILMKDDKSATQTQAVCYSETSKIFLDDTVVEGAEYATTGFWNVVKPFKAIALVHHNDFNQSHPEMLKARKVYNDFINQMERSENIMYTPEDFIGLMDFMSNQFARPVPYDKPYLYSLSNYFAAAAFNSGYDAIVFPSVKAEGSGLNIAMTPKATQEYLQLERVLVNKVIKRGKHSVADHYLICDEFQADGRFIWKELPPTGAVRINAILGK